MRTAISLVIIAAAVTGCAARTGGPARVPGTAPGGNRPPSIRARCEPCAVPAGGTVVVRVEASDADGDSLTYRWSAPSGSLAAADARETRWTAPMQDGPAPLTITVSDSKGGTATDAITIQVRRSGTH